MKKLSFALISVALCFLLGASAVSPSFMTAAGKDVKSGQDVDIDMFEPAGPDEDVYGFKTYGEGTVTFGETDEETSPTGEKVYKLEANEWEGQVFTTELKHIKLNTSYEMSVWVKHDLINMRFGAYVPTTPNEQFIESENDYAYDGSWADPPFSVGASHLTFNYYINGKQPTSILQMASGPYSSMYLMNGTPSEAEGNLDGWSKLSIKFTTDSQAVCEKDISLFLRIRQADGHPLYFSDLSLTELVGEVNVITEQGTDGGYVTENEGVYTAVPYAGNEFLGWYESDGLTLISDKDEETFEGKSGTIIAKFKNNSVFESPGYELKDNGNYMSTVRGEKEWFCSQSWGAAIVKSDGNAYSGNKYMEISTTYQADTSMDIKGLKPDTYYTVSYYWSIPATTDGENEVSHRGMRVTDTGKADVNAAAQNLLGGNYNETGDAATANVWTKESFDFYTGDLTDVRLFFLYTSKAGSGINIRIDEFTVYEAGLGEENPKYYATVSAENGDVYISTTDRVPAGTVINVNAAAHWGYKFDGWYENDVKVCDTVNYSFAIDANRKLVAKFVSKVDLSFDMNGDSKVDDADCVVINNHIIGKAPLSTELAQKADFNGDGKVSVSDIVMLRKNMGSGDDYEILEGDELKQAILNGTYQKFLDESIYREGNNVRIANAMRKALAGEEITIAAIGGSITEGAGSGDTGEDGTEGKGDVNKRYANLVKDWWETNFPDAKINYVNAGIGATTSLLGVNRVEEQVLEYNPDFVVVDFSANDNSGDTLYRDTYENLIRRLLESEKEPGVLAVHFGPTVSSDYDQGIYTKGVNSFLSHIQSEIFYDIPSIDVFETVWKYIDEGAISWPDFGSDYIHPNAAGHRIAASCINNYLDKVLEDIDNIGTEAPELPSNFFWGSDIYMNATALDSTDITLTENTGFAPSSYPHWTGWKTSKDQTAEMTFTLENCKVFTMMRRTAASGDGYFEVYIDDDLYTTVKTNIGNAITYWLAFNPYISETPKDIKVTIKAYGEVDISAIMYSDGTHQLNNYDAVNTSLKAVEDSVRLTGRTYWTNDQLSLDWIGSGFEVAGNFSGDFAIDASITSEKMNVYAIVDGDYDNPVNTVFTGSGSHVICTLEPGAHTIRLFKATEPSRGTMKINSISFNGKLYQKPLSQNLSIEVYGDSITSGASLYKAADQPDQFISQDGYLSYGNIVANALDAEVSIISRSGASVCTGSNKIQDFCYREDYNDAQSEWDYTSHQADVIVIGLGTNDTPFYTDDEQRVQLKNGVKDLLANMRAKNPDAKIVFVYGMMDTRNPEVYQNAVSEMNDDNMYFKMLPRNADGEGGHPTPEGHQAAAEVLLDLLEAII